MDDVVIVAAGRTAVGKFGGSIAKVAATDLGAHVIKGLLAKTGLAPDLVSEVIMGQVLTAGCGQNPARQAALRGGLPHGVPAMTIGVVCGSGLKATHLAAQAIQCGDANIVIAGGQESMSASAHVLLGSRDGFRMGDAKLVDTMIVDGLWDVYNQYHMGTTAENVAKKFGISRTQQDEFAVASQNKAEAAQKAGRFKDEILPFEIVTKKGTTVFRQRRVRQGRDDAEIDRRAAPRLCEGRQRDGRQCLGPERRRGGRDHDVGRQGARPGPAGAGAHQVLCLGRPGPGHDGHGPGAGLAAVPEEGRLERHRTWT